MSKWPESRWNQGWISFAAAMITAILVFHRTEHVLFEQAAREAPYDGQDGLSAFMGALQVSSITLIGVFVVVFAIQRAITNAQRN
jgi:hypothetical protein